MQPLTKYTLGTTCLFFQLNFDIITLMPELLTKANKKKHNKKHGFLVRSKTRSGKAVIKRRQLKGRKSV